MEHNIALNHMDLLHVIMVGNPRVLSFVSHFTFCSFYHQVQRFYLRFLHRGNHTTTRKDQQTCCMHGLSLYKTFLELIERYFETSTVCIPACIVQQPPFSPSPSAVLLVHPYISYTWRGTTKNCQWKKPRTRSLQSAHYL